MARGRRQEAEKVDKAEKRWKINCCSTWTVVSRSIIRANTLDAYTSFDTRGPSSGASNRQSRRSEWRPSNPSFEFFRREYATIVRPKTPHYLKGEKSLRRSGYFITCLCVCKILLSSIDKYNFALIVNRNISFEEHKIERLDDASRFFLLQLPHNDLQNIKNSMFDRKKFPTFHSIKILYKN